MLPDHFISFDGLNDLILNTAKKLDYQYRKYELNQSKQIHLRDQAEYLQLLSKSSQLTNQERQRTEYLANKMKSYSQTKTYFNYKKRIAKSLETGERPTTNFFKRFQNNSKNSYITNMDNDIEGINVSSVPVIEKHIYTHYSQLLNPVQQGQHNISLCQFIEKHNIEIPKICNSDKNDMSENITDQQILEAIAKLNKNSSSGPDGFTPRLIQQLFKLIPSMFYTAIRKELGEPGYTTTNSPNVKI